ncbi:tyrosine-type recombinase/integrase [Ensifer adhaerens]|uniref:tyrosine-type recombinase/integrase n=1 Tax=Ensifer adhaerens TaxID=106592 RepID=UPI0008074777|nr:tyrosine-type recombinase/integrase [Ensifer adhaerens]
MNKAHLTDDLVEQLPFASAGDRYEVYDASVPNLAVRVGPRTKTFILRRRVGRSRNSMRVKIGAYPEMKTVAAREQAGDWDNQARRGLDPTAAPAAKAAAELMEARSTFRSVLEDYIVYIPSRNRNLNAAGDIAFLRRNFLNAKSNPWLDKPISKVTAADVVSLIKQIQHRAPAQAYHALTQIKVFFGWAMHPDIADQIGLQSNPLAALRHMKLGLRIKARTRVLEREEVAAYLAACTATPYPYGPCLRTLIETAQRRGAVRKMRWPQINFARKVWVIPGKTSKIEDAHQVPLSDRMVALLRSLRDALPPEHGPYVFSATGGQKPIDNFGALKIVKSVKAQGADAGGRRGRFERHMLASFEALAPGQELEDWVWHDARRTARTHLEPITGRTEVAEAAIGHGPQGIVRVYNLYKYRSEIRRGFNAWSELLHKVELGTCTLAEWEHDSDLVEGADR